MCFHSQYSYLEDFKCSSRATLKCLAGRMRPAGRTLPRPDLVGNNEYQCTLGFCKALLYVQGGLVISTFYYITLIGTKKVVKKQTIHFELIFTVPFTFVQYKKDSVITMNIYSKYESM